MGKTGKLERFEPNVWMNRNVCVGLFHLCEYLRSDDLCRFIFWDQYCISHQTIHRFFRNFIVTRKWWSNNPFNESMLNFDVSYDQQRQMTLNDRIYIYILIYTYIGGRIWISKSQHRINNLTDIGQLKQENHLVIWWNASREMYFQTISIFGTRIQR